ncbi:MAG: hypothetical protein OEY01_13430 [Desulfobulbaceae bacterium]|nr:hypothetical protein [Desulfobulbaceae bacterium]HIJ79731.1 hypothetical protein [Deltaproteobacteria bacterium]
MAEIKSTMEMVMERAARMAANAGPDVGGDDLLKDGMRLGAAYLRGEEASLAAKLDSCGEAERPQLRKGVVQALLRNIMLPRDAELQEPAVKAMNGLIEVGQGDDQLLQVFSEMKKILEGFLQHREQLRQQIEAQFTQQMEAMAQSKGQNSVGAMKLQPSHHPKFKEEWSRIQAELNHKYGEALDKLKDMVSHKLIQ